MTHNRINVSAGLIWRSGKFLACQRPAGAPFAGFWELPGGKWEEGESGAEALARELREELGIEIRGLRFLQKQVHLYETDTLEVRLDFYEVADFHGEPAALEGQKLAWLDPAAAAGLEFLPADRAFIAELAMRAG